MSIEIQVLDTCSVEDAVFEEDDIDQEKLVESEEEETEDDD